MADLRERMALVNLRRVAETCVREAGIEDWRQPVLPNEVMSPAVGAIWRYVQDELAAATLASPGVPAVRGVSQRVVDCIRMAIRSTGWPSQSSTYDRGRIAGLQEALNAIEHEQAQDMLKASPGVSAGQEIDNGNPYIFCDYVDAALRGCVRGAGHNGPHAVVLPPYPIEPVLLAVPSARPKE